MTTRRLNNLAIHQHDAPPKNGKHRVTRAQRKASSRTRLQIAQTLREVGAQIIGPAPSVCEAFRGLVKRVELATLDIELLDGTSFPIADKLAQRGIPFVFVTGSGNALPAEHRLRPLCHKPLNRHDLLRALSAALAEQSDG